MTPGLQLWDCSPEFRALTLEPQLQFWGSKLWDRSSDFGAPALGTRLQLRGSDFGIASVTLGLVSQPLHLPIGAEGGISPHSLSLQPPDLCFPSPGKKRICFALLGRSAEPGCGGSALPWGLSEGSRELGGKLTWSMNWREALGLFPLAALR